jgi:probable phosphoglycerate mutase
VSGGAAEVVAPHRIVLVRHGNTFSPGDVVTRVGARTDLPLVASGIEQAFALGVSLRREGIQFDRAFCSPLRRTRETAEALFEALGYRPPLTEADALTEIDHGPDENQPEANVRARLGEAALRAWDEEAIPPPDWGIDPAAKGRAWSQFHAGAWAGEVRLVVTSNGAARFALTDYGRPPLPKLRTGALGRIVFDAQGGVTVEAWDVRPN